MRGKIEIGEENFVFFLLFLLFKVLQITSYCDVWKLLILHTNMISILLRKLQIYSAHENSVKIAKGYQKLKAWVAEQSCKYMIDYLKELYTNAVVHILND